MAMSEITREQLHAYLDDALSDAETARVEQALRDLRERLMEKKNAKKESAAGVPKE